MVKSPSFDINGIKSGVWSKEEDETLRAFVLKHGHHNWQKLPISAGLARSGKSCRLRWMNYLRPGLKKGNFSKEEVDLIIKLHAQIGNRWSAIAEKLAGRTDNDIKNQWHAHIKKRAKRSRFDEKQYSIGNNCFKEISDDQKDVCAQDSCAENSGVEAYDHRLFSAETSLDNDTCFGQLNIDFPPLIWEEELSTLGVCNSDGTPGGITYDHDHTRDFPPFSDLGLWHNDAPAFSDDSSDGGISSSDSALKNEREVFGFN